MTVRNVRKRPKRTKPDAPRPSEMSGFPIGNRTPDGGPDTRPAYLEEIIRLAESNAIKPGTLNHIEVRHDPWCSLLKRTGPCNCTPDVKLVRPS